MFSRTRSPQADDTLNGFNLPAGRQLHIFLLHPLNMFKHRIDLLLLTIATITSTSVLAQNTSTSALNITAISAANGSSTLECWQLDNFTVSNTPGTVGALSVFFGEASNVSYTVIPPRTDAGLHRAPAAQYASLHAAIYMQRSNVC